MTLTLKVVNLRSSTLTISGKFYTVHVKDIKISGTVTI